MKTSCVALLVACASCATSTDFEAYKQKFGKHYASPAAEAHAKECWEENIEYIAKQKNADTTLQLDENVFSDQCWKDFEQERLPGFDDNGICTKSPIPAYTKPYDLQKSVDWRTEGYVTPVKDQKSCGSCWAFSAIGCMEGANFKATGKLLEFSEQDLVSCDPKNNGCSGGMPGEAFQFAVQNGIASEVGYPYVAKSASCDQTKKAKTVASFSKMTYVTSTKDEKVLLAAIQNEGPISITVGANQLWHQYSGGIVKGSQCPGGGGINHAVLAVGYGFDGDQPYYIVRNSWGKNWGENGYIRLAFNENVCSVRSCLSAFVEGQSSAVQV